MNEISTVKQFKHMSPLSVKCVLKQKQFLKRFFLATNFKKGMEVKFTW